MTGGLHDVQNGAQDAEVPEPLRIRQLRLLVTTLLIVLIVGFLVIVAAMVIRLSAAPTAVELPQRVDLPPGEIAQAVTLGADWVALVTVDGDGTERVRVFSRATGREIGQMAIDTSDS
jgi:hypothetical protein